MNICWYQHWKYSNVNKSINSSVFYFFLGKRKHIFSFTNRIKLWSILFDVFSRTQMYYCLRTSTKLSLMFFELEAKSTLRITTIQNSFHYCLKLAQTSFYGSNFELSFKLLHLYKIPNYLIENLTKFYAQKHGQKVWIFAVILVHYSCSNLLDNHNCSNSLTHLLKKFEQSNSSRWPHLNLT